MTQSKKVSFFEKIKYRTSFIFINIFSHDLFEDLDHHSWPRGSQLKEQLKLAPGGKEQSNENSID